MSGKFVGFIRKAIYGSRSGPSRHVPSHREFNLRDYMPKFSAQDHAIARENGYRDAEDQWLFESKGELATHAEIERRRQAKLQKLLDMESDGVPMEDLIGIAKRSSELPTWTAAGPLQVNVPADPVTLQVKVAGIINWYIQQVERLSSYGLNYDMSEDDVPYANRGRFREALREREKIAIRLEACGENIDIIHEHIVQGLIGRVDYVKVVVPSDNPLIRQIQADEEAMRDENGDGEDTDTGSTLTVVIDADATVPGLERTTSDSGGDSEESDDGDAEEEPAEHDTEDPAAPAEDESEWNDDVVVEDTDVDAAPEDDGSDGSNWDAGWSDPWN